MPRGPLAPGSRCQEGAGARPAILYAPIPEPVSWPGVYTIQHPSSYQAIVNNANPDRRTTDKTSMITICSKCYEVVSRPAASPATPLRASNGSTACASTVLANPNRPHVGQ